MKNYLLLGMVLMLAIGLASCGESSKKSSAEESFQGLSATQKEALGKLNNIKALGN